MADDSKRQAWCGVGFQHNIFAGNHWDYDEDGPPPKDYQAPGIHVGEVSRDSTFLLPNGVAGGIGIGRDGKLDPNISGPYANPDNNAHHQFMLRPNDEIVGVIERNLTPGLKGGEFIYKDTRGGQNNDIFRNPQGSIITMMTKDGRRITAQRRAFHDEKGPIEHDQTESGDKCSPYISELDKNFGIKAKYAYGGPPNPEEFKAAMGLVASGVTITPADKAGDQFRLEGKARVKPPTEEVAGYTYSPL